MIQDAIFNTFLVDEVRYGMISLLIKSAGH
jgi:hypothetical protein